MKVQAIGGLSAAIVAVAFAFGGSQAVRAENPEMSDPHETVIARIIRTVGEFGERLGHVESTVDAFASSLVSRQITAQRLCVADESGAQTCISKAELDGLLAMQAQLVAGHPVASETTNVAVETPTQPEISKTVTELPAQPEAAPAAEHPETAAVEPAQPQAEPAIAAGEQPKQSEEAASLQPEPVRSEATARSEPGQPEISVSAQTVAGQPAGAVMSPGEPAMQAAEAPTAASEPAEAVASRSEPAQRPGSAIVQSATATGEEAGAATETHEIAVLPTQEVEEPVATGSIAPTAPAAIVEPSLPPLPAISAPETMPAGE